MFGKVIRSVLFLLIGSIGFWGMAGFAANAQAPGFFPAYYEVYNVASDDVLNIRADSDSGAPIIGSLAYNASPVEVLKTEGNWGYVALNEGMGWVYMKFLRPVTLPTVGQSNIPVGLSCGGTEPFWGFSLAENSIQLSDMNEGEQAFNIVTAKNYQGRGGWDGFIIASGQQSMMTAVLSTDAQCSDGMSDLDFGWRVDMLITDAGGTNGKTGCCSMR